MADFEAEQAFLKTMQDGSETVIPTTNGAAAQSEQKQPRTIGGFIDDDEDDDDDDEEYDPVASIQETANKGPYNVDRGHSSTPQQSVPQSPASAVLSHASSKPASLQDQSNISAPVSQGAAADPSAALAAVVTDDSERAVNPPSASAAVTPTSAAAPADAPSFSKSRLPHDRLGMLEDRIKEDPRGDIEAWLSLISEHKKRNKLNDARSAYDRFFAIFPHAAEQWVNYADMELEQNEFYKVEQIFNKSLLAVPNVHLWSTYLNYVRRRNNLNADSSGNARQIVNQTYEFVLQHVGIDKDSGPLWQDYVQFLRSGPGQIGGSGWQDQQKMDALRKAYQRAICIPTQAVNALWKEYDSFEMGLNKMTGRKFLQEKSPSYMTARSSNTALQNLTRDLNRTTLPSLPPAFGFDGDVEYTRQVEIWRQWIAWEKEDPLVLKEEDEAAYKARILFVYKQATMALRFWPDIWSEAADFCFDNGMDSNGNDFMTNGTFANPESCLLAFKRADRVESTMINDEGEESVVRRGKAVREPYDKVLDALYDLINKIKEREAKTIARINEHVAGQGVLSTVEPEDRQIHESRVAQPDTQTVANAQVEALQNGNAAQVKLLGRTISFVWIALMRAMRRVQGKGKVGDPIGGSRQIFTDARARGRIQSDVYVASALIEYHCYKDPAATKIFERGMKLFKEDEQFALEYLKHLVAINDITNARAVFETTVNRLAQKPETTPKAKPLYAYFHDFEARYGELSHVSKLEQRMKDLFPEDPLLVLFAARFTSQGFDPTAIRPIISPASQTRPKGALPMVDHPQSVQNSPRPSVVMPFQTTSSPKRPLDDSDNESIPPRKIARGESPLKGAAGRRLNAKNQTNLRNEVQLPSGVTALPTVVPPPSLPREVLFLLSIIPRAETYNATHFHPGRIVDLLRHADLSKAQLGQSTAAPTPQPAVGSYAYPPSLPNYGYSK